ncbi:phosphatidylinositol glycan anchor biosynthesis class N [Oratosquilla oratoria]|uniref:phosphatidylinositol glycan anchor biosynthesis class N n=1 Tax=Oratosquilla oratoria TaxID=337810 RepID=UPI003F76111E
MWLFVVGIAVHLVFFGSVFDIYFRTPIIHGMTPQSISLQPAAERLVLFVADGLRAETFYSYPNSTTRAPYLRSIIEEKGTWGVSHTRVPTESRPGHVAIIAGFYEDPSAIARGWQENPVEFDSVFNESRHTWSWGSPDILPMFARGSERGHVDTFMYKSAQEDFASEDASRLDKWVFDEVEKFFLKAKDDAYLSKRLKQDRIIFFLHLLGLDTNGHAHKPFSAEYLQNIELVDKGVEKMVKVFEDFYGDKKTAYVFTSDHGMTDWGSHGAGDPTETETPIVMWGQGVAPPQDPSSFKERMQYDSRVEEWGLTHVRRHDVYQADIAPLMASVIAIPIPVNSVGVLPIEYLNVSNEYKAEAIVVNAKQILSQYQQKRQKKEEELITFLHKPFTGLMPDAALHRVTQINNHMKEKNFEEAITLSHELIVLCMRGLDYYHHYDRFALSTAITLGFIGWIVLIICHILKEHSLVMKVGANTVEGRRVARKGILFPALLFNWAIVTIVVLFAQSSPAQHYLYFLTPLGLWALVHQRIESLWVAWLIIKSYNMIWEVAIRLLFVIVGIEILVFSFFVRPMLSVGLLCIGVWPVVMYSLQAVAEKSMRLGWIGACILLASFTYMPVVGQDAIYPMVEVGGVIAFLLAAVGIYWCGTDKGIPFPFSVTMVAQGVMVLTSVYVVHTTAYSIAHKDGLPIENQLVSWALLVLTFIIPLFGSRQVMARLLAITCALLCPFLLLSIRHEVFFYIALSIGMFLWLILEYYLGGVSLQLATLKFAYFQNETATKDGDRLMEWSDVRRAYFFLFFIFLAFFGTGNLASINSFDPTFVYCFVTVFSPFVMGGLLLFKIVIPFLLVTCFFHAICTLIQVPTRAVFYTFLVMSDIMALHFFFLVRTEGSWLDIGTTLSHYIISMTTTVFLIFLLFIAKFLTLTKFGKEPKGESVLPRVSVGRPHRD